MFFRRNTLVDAWCWWRWTKYGEAGRKQQLVVCSCRRADLHSSYYFQLMTIFFWLPISKILLLLRHFFVASFPNNVRRPGRPGAHLELLSSVISARLSRVWAQLNSKSTLRVSGRLRMYVSTSAGRRLRKTKLEFSQFWHFDFVSS